MEEHEAPWLENGRRFRHLPRVVQLSAHHRDVRAVPLADGAHAIEARLIVEPFAVVRDPQPVLQADREAHPAGVVRIGEAEPGQHRLGIGARREHLRGVDDAVVLLEGRHGEPVPVERLVHLESRIRPAAIP